jgi:predicted unusual protein kinase regulating ubiquinone biosynthesis (AarF/ABC1/UbiB family)
MFLDCVAGTICYIYTGIFYQFRYESGAKAANFFFCISVFRGALMDLDITAKFWRMCYNYLRSAYLSQAVKFKVVTQCVSRATQRQREPTTHLHLVHRLTLHGLNLFVSLKTASPSKVM